MSSNRPRTIGLAIVSCLFIASGVIGAYSIRITIPSDGTYIIDGATFAVLGNVRVARVREGNGWRVIHPEVLLEMYYKQNLQSPPYLISSDAPGTTFPYDTSTTGKFNGSLTATQVGSFVAGYYIEATALDEESERSAVSTEISVFVTPSDPQPPGF